MPPIIIAVTGASAQLLAEKTIQILLEANHSIEVILSKGAYEVWRSENDILIPLDTNKQETFWRSRTNSNNGCINCHKWNNNSAGIASGSYITKGMIIVPCSMGTLGRVAAGASSNLIERCADVHLKEGRTLIISPRESPFNLIHLRNMTSLCESGARIVPCMPSWYSKPKDINEMLDFMISRLLDPFSIDSIKINRWEGKL